MTLDRRSFLTHAGAGLVAAAALDQIAAADTIKLPEIGNPTEAPAQPPPLPDEPGKRLGIAVVGIGRLTLEQLLPGFAQSRSTKLVALVSGDRKKAEQVAAHTGVEGKRIFDYAGFDRIKDDPAIEAVYIVLPNHLHAEYTVRAARAGKHVLCEKPMATSTAEAQTMIDACKQADRRLMIAYRMQYEPHQQFAMKATRDQRFGKIRLIEGHNGQNQGSPDQWRLKKGGGALYDVGIYCLNTTRFLLGEEPSWIQGQTYSTPGDPRFKEVDESTLFQMGFPGGAMASHSCSFSTHRAQRYRAIGDKGGWIDLDPAYAYEGLQLAVGDVRDGQDRREVVRIPQKQQFALELDHFAQCVRQNKTPYTPGEEGLQDLKLMEAIFESARTGKRIELPRFAKLDAFRGTPPSA